MTTNTQALGLHTTDILGFDGDGNEYVIVTLTGFTQVCNDECHPGNCEIEHGKHFGEPV